MKTVAALLAMVLIATLSHAAGEAKTLNDFLDERIALNIQYRDEFAAAAKLSPVGKELAPVEKEIGDEWVRFLKYVRASKDKKLKVHTLRLELLEEVRGTYYDLECAQDAEEVKATRKQLANWKQKLAAVDKLAAAADGP